MKSIIIIYFYVLLLTIVSNGVGGGKLCDILDDMVTEKGSINGLFEPLRNGLLDENVMEHTYEVLFLPRNMTVAMKFTSKGAAEYQYKLYSYLNAINNPKVEALGISAIYYYGTWRNYHILAMTLHDRKFYHMYCGKHLKEIDIFILFREFVRITKYMHTNGVFNAKIAYYDIVFRKHQGFIHDIYFAESLSNLIPEKRLTAAQTAWIGFISSIFPFIQHPKRRWGWLGISNKNGADESRMLNVTNFVFSLRNDSEMSESHNFRGLRKVFVEFAKWAFNNDTTLPITSFYDQMYGVIVEELERYAQQREKPAIPSWLFYEEDINKAISAIKEIPDISKIRDPFELERIEHAEVNYEFLTRHYRTFRRDQPSSSWASELPVPENQSRNFANCFRQQD